MNAERLSELLDAHVDGRLTGPARAELEHALLTSAEARRSFWVQVSLHGLTHEAARMRWADGAGRAAEPGLLAWLMAHFRPYKFAWAGALAVALGLAGFLLTSKPPVAGPGAVAKAPRVPMLMGIRGDVFIVRAGSEQRALADIALQEDVAVRVAPEGAATVVLPDSTSFSLEGGAAVALHGADLKQVSLEAGVLRARVARQQDGQQVELSTPLAHVVVWGTAFTLDAGARATRIDVSEGRVRMAHARRSSEMDLAGGEFAVAQADSDLVAGFNQRPPAVPGQGPPADPDPAQHPFASDSPWNRPLGKRAAFAAVQSEGFDFAQHGAAVMPARLDRTLILARPEDPEVPVTMRYGGAELARVRCSLEALRLVRDDGNCVIVDAERGCAHELSHVRQADESIGAMGCLSNDLRGAGVSPESVGPSFSGLPLLAGLIREGELVDGIRHALSATVLHQGLSRADAPFVWPARHAPMERKMIDHMGATGNVHYGSLLAIPPEVDIRALGVGQEGPAFEIARALQVYGAYVTHSFNAAVAPAGGWVQPHIQFFADGVGDAQLRALAPQLARVAAQLKVVANNGTEEQR